MKSTRPAHFSTAFSEPQQALIEEAAARLRAGGTVAFPTETVYGLGADVTNPAAIKKIYSIKQRPAEHPLIVHIGNISQLSYWAEEIPESAWTLAHHFWPGPLTLILQRSSRIPDCVTGGQHTVGLRMPAHPIALALLNALGPQKALAAPSANRFGRISPTTAEHVRQELGSTVDLILDGGACEVGLESTIVSFHDRLPHILRPGGITLSALETALESPFISTTADPAIRTSGSLPSHYAPATPLRIHSTELIGQHVSALGIQNLRVLIMTWSEIELGALRAHASIQIHSMPRDPVLYGRQLYATLRHFDQAGFDYLLVEAPPDHPDWLAIIDRLQRASHH
ncbi:threonylcarbamoyl-AMP synthase [Nitrosomonas sp. JL21]|uniref:L-threonylcarbamoyladenylate synthase n=1 Tax=Nitrosomonas sp. JL21 TaxID=153949 RepID=UPI00136C8224|nr:L-threonylcarbamoyladenylate synthase [Nitrosomonas sp. JL21]MBL8497008.1 threonylcarbamoyl-AMP synthase [Nitrosomonas sp.]MCC7091071.1 threonylcarbamoyl-AMP synthase [Nitrosomonas sp.]MXS78153.1 threonylcarbamoyl-AMP synthase [Nitrosomonas sp. JL21]